MVDLRKEMLLQIPFKAILTTSFDRWLPGMDTSPDTVRRVLRRDGGQWWDLPENTCDVLPRVPVIKLHGDASAGGVVLGRGDYRQRIHAASSYTAFLRAAFAQYTVLFLGVSFTDAYLNELRSETLHLLYGASPDLERPWGYATMLRTPGLAALFRAHEGIELLEMADYSEFDDWLAHIARRTSLRGRLGELLDGKDIVWIDTHPANNVRGRALFRECGATVHEIATEAQLDRERHGHAALVITQFGHDPTSGEARAHHVLDALRGWPVRPPVIVFASPGLRVAENRRSCLARGAWEYATQWSELYRSIEVLFARTPGFAVS
jgi:hypothetical protein